MSDTPRSVEDYYAVLGVTRDATTQDIKKAFRKIARECHPDVAGDNPVTRRRFEAVRAAYEVLVDPVERSRYDRRRQPHSNPFVGGFWGFQGAAPDADTSSGFHASSRPGNDIGLEDIFNDFGAFDDFGFGGAGPGAGPGAPPPPPPGSQPGPMPPPPRQRRERGTERRGRSEPRHPQAGQDIALKVHVPADVAARGGLVTVQYQRLVRSDDGSTLKMFDEIHDLRVPPDTKHGDTLRVPRQGHASLGGLPGELVCDVLIEGKPDNRAASGATASEGSARPGRGESSSATGRKDDPLPLPVSVSEALLGGRVEVSTPGGSVRLVVPPCTSSGTLLRLRGKNRLDPDAPATDLYLEVRIVMPSSLDDESRDLVLRFAQLNPYDPRA